MNWGMMRRVALTAAAILAGAVGRASAQQPEPLRFLNADTLVLEVRGGAGIGFTVGPLRAAGVPMRLLLVGSDGRERIMWQGTSGARPVWNGFADDSLPASGTYDIVAEVGSGTSASRIRRPVRLDVEAARTGESIPLLPEVDTVVVRDFQAEVGWRRRQIATGVAGIAVALVASSVVSQAIEASSPGAPLRQGVAVGYVGGLALGVYSGARLALGWNRRVERRVVVPLEANMRRNRVAAAPRPPRIVLRFLDGG